MRTFTHRTSARARRLTLKIEPNGEIVVVTPPRTSKSQIESLVEQAEPWIERTLRKLAKRRPGAGSTELTLFGKSYTPIVRYSTQQPIGVTAQQTELVINPTDPTHTLKHASVQRQLTQFFKATAEKYIVPRTHQLAAVMNTTFASITLRQQKTRWGSCSSRGSLNFNWRLVHYPPEIIDYVIVHELAHRTHMNHSDSFWGLVARYDSNHTQHRRWLRQHGMTVG